MDEQVTAVAHMQSAERDLPKVIGGEDAASSCNQWGRTFSGIQSPDKNDIGR